MENADRRTRLRTFVIGGALGAAGAIATVRRSRRKREAAAGLAAFEDAPCFLEEALSYREAGGEMLTGTSKPT
jgi:hypothetical protein